MKDRRSGEVFARATWDEFAGGLERELAIHLPKYDALSNTEQASLQTAAEDMMHTMRMIIGRRTSLKEAPT